MSVSKPEVHLPSFLKWGYAVGNVNFMWEFLELGYEEHLSPLVSLHNAEETEKREFPNSNCIIMAKKAF